MTETSLLAGVQDRQKKVASVQNPMRRLGLPEDVAGAVAFLVGPDGDYINGETLVVDGGTSMH
jgi:3-oxoacyl-[acyl-carrier protein] reductase